MKIAACTIVKNEQKLIRDNLWYHLNTQGFDFIVVVDNGSYDRTREEILSLNDPRIILTETGQTGFIQAEVFTRTSQMLFEQYGCDWVVPYDADEFWVSQTHASVRNVLESLPKNIDVAVTFGYQFHETELDDSRQAHFAHRLQYASHEDLSRVLLYRMKDRISFIPNGAHYVETPDQSEPRTAVLDPRMLARFHYRYLSKDDFRRRIMNKAEGYMFRFGEEWLWGEHEKAQRILRWYNHIKNGTFDNVYKRKMVWTREKVEHSLSRGTVFKMNRLASVMPPPEATPPATPLNKAKPGKHRVIPAQT